MGRGKKSSRGERVYRLEKIGGPDVGQGRIESGHQ